MSIPSSGTFTRSKGIIDAIKKQLRTVTLKPVGKVSIKFDPFSENANETRNFLIHLTNPKIRLTNPSCIIKTEVLSDRKEPNVEFKLTNGESILFKSGNLTSLELLQLVNKYITPLAPPPEDTTSTIATKSSKKVASKRQKY